MSKRPRCRQVNTIVESVYFQTPSFSLSLDSRARLWVVEVQSTGCEAVIFDSFGPVEMDLAKI